jgi:lysophospholipase L1-like esterase
MLKPLRALSLKGWIALGLYAVAFGLLSRGGWARDLSLVAIAIGLLVAAAVLLQLALKDAAERARRLVPVLIFAGGAAALAVWWIGLLLGAVPGGLGLAGVCAMYLGIGHGLTEFRRHDDHVLGHGVRITAGCAIAFVIGLVVCFTLTTLGLGLIAGGLLIAPAGLTLLSEGVLRQRRGWLAPAAWTAPMLIFAGGWSAGYALHMQPALALVCASLVGVLMLAITSSTQADVLLVVTAIGIVWASQPSGTASDDFPAPTDGQPALVALGDSYISGEGASEFLEGTNDAGGNQCRRAPQAYPRRVFADGQAGDLQRLAFLACSGAETDDLRTKQLPRLKAMIDDGLHPRLVVVSIGGNDVGFADIATACVAPGSCAERGQLWLDRLPSVAREIYDTYVDIRQTVRMDVPVLAVPYPVPVRERPCRYSTLGADENRFLQRFAVQLDRAVRHSAREAGLAYLARMRGVLTRARLRICDAPEREDVGINFIRLKSVHGVVEQLLDPRIWVHNSFHPNETGHEQMAGVLEQWIADHPVPRPGPAPTGFTTFTPPSLADVMGPEVGRYCGDSSRGEPRYCGRGDASWALTKVAGAFGALSPALLFLVAGWWLLSLALLQRRRHPAQGFQRPEQ